MATSYQGFWLIVGMTVAAVVVGNATSTKHGSPKYSSSAGRSAPSSSSTATPQSSTTADSYQPQQQSSVPSTSTSLPSLQNSVSQPPVTRNRPIATA